MFFCPLCFFCLNADMICRHSQFQYNPEWFQDVDDGDESDDWDLSQYRRQKEEEDMAEEEQRIATLALQDFDDR